MTPELRKRIEAILAAPKRATNIELCRAVTCIRGLAVSTREKKVLNGAYDMLITKYIPDPRQWWPLAWEILDYMRIQRRQSFERLGDELHLYWLGDYEMEIEDIPSRAVCLAYLKMKLEEGKVE